MWLSVEKTSLSAPGSNGIGSSRGTLMDKSRPMGLNLQRYRCNHVRFVPGLFR